MKAMLKFTQDSFSQTLALLLARFLKKVPKKKGFRGTY